LFINGTNSERVFLFPDFAYGNGISHHSFSRRGIVDVLAQRNSCEDGGVPRQHGNGRLLLSLKFEDFENIVVFGGKIKADF
jgi:hypothetical protein